MSLQNILSDIVFHAARFFEYQVPDLSLENLRHLIRSSLLHVQEYIGRLSQQTETVNLHNVAFFFFS